MIKKTLEATERIALLAVLEWKEHGWASGPEVGGRVGRRHTLLDSFT